jgi:hypothetical protein
VPLHQGHTLPSAGLLDPRVNLSILAVGVLAILVPYKARKSEPGLVDRVCTLFASEPTRSGWDKGVLRDATSSIGSWLRANWPGLPARQECHRLCKSPATGRNQPRGLTPTKVMNSSLGTRRIAIGEN